MRVRDLKRYLEDFPDDAEVLTFNGATYDHHYCEIACNREWQIEHKAVMLTRGIIKKTLADQQEELVDEITKG